MGASGEVNVCVCSEFEREGQCVCMRERKRVCKSVCGQKVSVCVCKRVWCTRDREYTDTHGQCHTESATLKVLIICVCDRGARVCVCVKCVRVSRGRQNAHHHHTHQQHHFSFHRRDRGMLQRYHRENKKPAGQRRGMGKMPRLPVYLSHPSIK